MIVPVSLSSLIDRARNALANARTSAEILEAKDRAGVVYDAAKKAARLAKAKGAHDTLIAAAHRTQADALEIEAGAKMRLADEYDAAQERGEINRHGGDRKTDDFKFENSKLEDIKPDQLHEARIIRDAEAADPGIVRRVLNEKLAQGGEPTKAALRQELIAAAEWGLRGCPQRRTNRNPLYVPPSEAEKAWTHVYGTAREFVEWATEENIALAISGLNEREDSQAANIRAVRRCSAVLTDLVSKLDA